MTAKNETRNTGHIMFLRPREVWQRLGVSRSTVYQQQKLGLLPPFQRIGMRASALAEHELTEIQTARMAGCSDDDIKALVSLIVEERKPKSER